MRGLTFGVILMVACRGGQDRAAAPPVPGAAPAEVPAAAPADGAAAGPVAHPESRVGPQDPRPALEPALRAALADAGADPAALPAVVELFAAEVEAADAARRAVEAGELSPEAAADRLQARRPAFDAALDALLGPHAAAVRDGLGRGARAPG